MTDIKYSEFASFTRHSVQNPCRQFLYYKLMIGQFNTVVVILHSQVKFAIGHNRQSCVASPQPHISLT